MTTDNPLGLDGFAFCEFTSPDPTLMAAQLEHMSRMHEHEDGLRWVLAGDFNVWDGEDKCVRTEGRQDVWTQAHRWG